MFVLRVLSRRELSSLSASDLILLVVLGDLIQNGVTQSDMSMTGVTIAITTFVLLTVASSYLSFKSARARKVIQGEPLIIVENGQAVDLDRVWPLFARTGYRGFTSAEYEGEEDPSTGVPKLVEKIKTLCRKYSSV